MQKKPKTQKPPKYRKDDDRLFRQGTCVHCGSMVSLYQPTNPPTVYEPALYSDKDLKLHKCPPKENPKKVNKRKDIYTLCLNFD